MSQDFAQNELVRGILAIQLNDFEPKMSKFWLQINKLQRQSSKTIFLSQVQQDGTISPGTERTILMTGLLKHRGQRHRSDEYWRRSGSNTRLYQVTVKVWIVRGAGHRIWQVSPDRHHAGLGIRKRSL
jgi:hypothetical protein